MFQKRPFSEHSPAYCGAYAPARIFIQNHYICSGQGERRSESQRPFHAPCDLVLCTFLDTSFREFAFSAVRG